MLYLAIAVVIMFHMNWRLAAVVLCFVPVPAILAAWAGPEQNRRERELLERWARIYSRFNEVLSGLVTVRSYSMEDAEKRQNWMLLSPDEVALSLALLCGAAVCASYWPARQAGRVDVLAALREE